MKPTDDPPRLLEPDAAASAALRAALEAAKAEGPSADALARIAGRLPIVSGAPPRGSPGGGRGAPGGAGPGVAEPLLGSGVVGSAAIGALLGALVSVAILRDPAPPPAPPAPAPPAAESAQPPAPERPAASADVAPEARARGGAAAEPSSPAAAGAPAIRGSAAPDLPSPSAAAPVEEGESEVALLQRAQDALAVDPARALAIADEHLRRFPEGVLGQEREVIAVSALVRAGRTAEARARAARFIEKHPESAHRRRIEALLPSGAPP
jgi:hypothetical protein